ncbi:short chain dehydrogenase [Roseobacter cerasinus]|uniref:Short chain dehydrogenase n=1 Tax=Roseobacter cerasinus TaxID=2602289 RepID=A0A640VW70_9RHOB|nr:SDR family NAD(P)-dependent oxidoreductase [Roseobacter cerasinus]GFE51882.1 short chain dehydrogenase [Roseobacter cerasinus]
MNTHTPVTLVTGGTQGMGLTTARHLAQDGHQVIICGRRADAGVEAETALTGEGLDVRFLQCDVAEDGAAEALVAQIVADHGRLDAAFNNAGITVPVAPLAQSDPAVWRQAIDVNLTGVYYCLRAQIRAMRETGGGAIVNNSSLAGVTAVPGQPAYVASKFGVIGLSQAAAIENARDPEIRINVVAPGPISGGMNTEEALAKDPERTKQKLRVTAMRRLGRPEDVSQIVAWLLSSQAAYVTGAVFPIDGGASAGKF